MIALAEKHLSTGNMAGEGWLLTAEMAKLLRSGIDNIVCLQPFACLPNHVTGKGMIRELLRTDPQANIIALDCDADASRGQSNEQDQADAGNSKRKAAAGRRKSHKRIKYIKKPYVL